MRKPRTHALLRRLHGRKLGEVVVERDKRLKVNFQDGAVLLVAAEKGGLLSVQVDLEGQNGSRPARPKGRPTARQRQYLTFIAKYMRRYGVAPAESDMQRHFLVAGPTVNEMMKMLERRGFITRQPGVPRSIRLRIDVARA